MTDAVTRLRCAPDVAWTVETGGLALFRRDTGATRMLPCPQAALWDVLSRGVPLERAVQIIAAVTRKGQAEARAWIAETTREWVRSGWLARDGADG